jgi:hypothetical protein
MICTLWNMLGKILDVHDFIASLLHCFKVGALLSGAMRKGAERWRKLKERKRLFSPKSSLSTAYGNSLNSSKITRLGISIVLLCLANAKIKTTIKLFIVSMASDSTSSVPTKNSNSKRGLASRD